MQRSHLHYYIPSIEYVEKEEPFKIIESLIWAVRNISDQMLEQGDSKALKLLAAFESSYILRIELYLRSKYPLLDFERTGNLLRDASVLTADYLAHERALLLESAFSLLPEEAQCEYLKFVAKGPDLTEFIKNKQQYDCTDPTKEEIKQEQESWIWNYLCPIYKHLTGEWKKRFDDLEAKFGSCPDLHEYKSRFGSGWVESVSPRPIEDLEKLSISELANFVNSYHTPEEYRRRWHIDYIGGLAEAVKTLFNKNPDKFLLSADSLLELKPPYIHAILHSLSALKENEFIIMRDNWPTLISFFNKLLSKTHRTLHSDTSQGHEESGLSLFGGEIASIIHKGLDITDSSYSIDIQLRDRIWSIIKKLLQNFEGSAIRENETEEPLTVAINTPRGKAFYAMIAYALWVKRNSSDLVAFNLKNHLPEVQEALNEKLDPNKEPMISLRSLFGRCLPLLITLDLEWTAEHIETIFPLDDQLLFTSAIIGYLWGLLRDVEYRLLKPVFLKAVREFGPEIDQKYSYLRPANRLAMMLAMAILRGINSYDDETDPITVMKREGHIYLRSRIIESLGHFVYQQDLPYDFVSRAQDYWDRRVDSLESSNDPNEWQELNDISNWYVSGKFDEDWVLTQFEKVVNKKVEIEYIPELIEAFSENVKTDPDRVFELLRKLTLNALESPNQLFIHLFSYDDITPVLREAYTKGKEETKKAVREFSSRMASRGFTKFRDAIKDLENES